MQLVLKYRQGIVIKQSEARLETPTGFPNSIRIAPLVGIKYKMSRGWLLFSLAKNLVKDGCDHVARELVWQFCKSIGFKQRTYERMLNSARGLGLVSDIQRKDGHWDLILISNRKASKESTGQEKQKTVWINPKLLVGAGWKANIWASYEATFKGGLISRKTLEELSGVPEVTQRTYDKQAGVKRVQNYAVSNLHASLLDSTFEYGKRACPFKYRDEKTLQWKLGWRLPDSRFFASVETSGSSNKKARALSLFNETDEQMKKSIKRISKKDLPVRELYVYSKKSKKGNLIWTHCPLV